jgi:hypothetical protein
MPDIFSPDGTLKAVIAKRADGKYQIEFHQFKRDHSMDFGDSSGWHKLPGTTIVASMEDAVALASQHLGLGVEDFFDEEDEG